MAVIRACFDVQVLLYTHLMDRDPWLDKWLDLIKRRSAGGTILELGCDGGLRVHVMWLFVCPLDIRLPPSYNLAQHTYCYHSKNADEDEYTSKRFPESRAEDGASKAKAQKSNGPPS